jgi:hypothetical protein
VIFSSVYLCDILILFLHQLITPYIRILDFDWLIADVFFCIFIFRPVKISANIWINIAFHSLVCPAIIVFCNMDTSFSFDLFITGTWPMDLIFSVFATGVRIFRASNDIWLLFLGPNQIGKVMWSLDIFSRLALNCLTV